jgi:hypothetical protein
VDPDVLPPTERERFCREAMFVLGPGGLEWASRMWDRWDVDPWALLRQIEQEGAS